MIVEVYENRFAAIEQRLTRIEGQAAQLDDRVQPRRYGRNHLYAAAASLIGRLIAALVGPPLRPDQRKPVEQARLDVACQSAWL